MDDLPSISSGSVGSRFVSENDLDEAKRKREEQWAAAYARLGQKPPEQPKEEVYDGRSLAEKLAANKAAAQEEWEQKMKLSNQFRSLEEDEVVFLDSVRERQMQEERERKKREGEELKQFREAVAARESETSKPPVIDTPPPKSSMSNTTKPKPLPAVKNKDKLKGVIVKKKSATPKNKAEAKRQAAEITTQKDSDDQPETKRRRIEGGS